MSEFKLGPIQEQWLQSLEQHPERQLTGLLGSKCVFGDHYRACCLGELGLISGLCEWDGNFLKTKDRSPNSKFLENVYTQVGLRRMNGAAENEDNVNVSLAIMNDGGKTWPEIAAIVRADPSIYFIKSV